MFLFYFTTQLLKKNAVKSFEKEIRSVCSHFFCGGGGATLIFFFISRITYVSYFFNYNFACRIYFSYYNTMRLVFCFDNKKNKKINFAPQILNFNFDNFSCHVHCLLRKYVLMSLVFLHNILVQRKTLVILNLLSCSVEFA